MGGLAKLEATEISIFCWELRVPSLKGRLKLMGMFPVGIMVSVFYEIRSRQTRHGGLLKQPLRAETRSSIGIKKRNKKSELNKPSNAVATSKVIGTLRSFLFFTP